MECSSTDHGDILPLTLLAHVNVSAHMSYTIAWHEYALFYYVQP